jgi:hypothetical protein
MLTCDGPHQTNIGKRELRQIDTAMRRLSGQPATGPSGVRDQSDARSRRPVSVSGTEPRPGAGVSSSGSRLMRAHGAGGARGEAGSGARILRLRSGTC